MSHKEYVVYFDTKQEAYDALFKRLPIWRQVRGTRTMKVEKYEHKWWIIIIEK